MFAMLMLGKLGTCCCLLPRRAQCEMKQLPNRHWRRLPAGARHSLGLKPIDVPTARQDRQPKHSIATFPAHRFANHRCLRTTSCVDDYSDAFRRLCPRPRAKQIPTQIESQAAVPLREHPRETAPNSSAHLFCEPVARERAPQQSECVHARCPIARPCREPQAANVPPVSFFLLLNSYFLFVIVNFLILPSYFSPVRSTIFPIAPGSMIARCACAASASGNSLPITGRNVPFSRPATSAA